jgi:hypothetical protein
MKIRNRWAIGALGFLASGFVRGLLGTVHYQFHALGLDARPTRSDLSGRYIYTFWHEYLLLPAYHYGQPNVHVLISRSDDGQLIAKTCQHLGFSVVRGSSSRGGIEAVRQMVRLSSWGHLAVTPDGPRGPRRHVQMGTVYLASRTGLPVVPTGFGVRRAWRAGSWDRFCVPKPFTRARCVLGEPITVPADLTSTDLERYRLRLENAISHATSLAERWAETDQRPLVAPKTSATQDAQAGAA